MKQYYTLKLKLTPKQVAMFEQILSEGITGILENASKGAEENILVFVESKIDKAMADSGYNRDMYNSA